MSNHGNISQNSGLIHKLAVLCKDYYVIRTTDDLFMFAGADSSMYSDLSEDENDYPMSRIDNFYNWINGIKEKASSELDRIINGVALQIIENERIPEGDRSYISRQLEASEKTNHYTSHFPVENISVPNDVEKLLEILINGLPRAMYPLKYNRREGTPTFAFDNEYDVQSLLHAILRPWIRDIRPEEYTPSYAGTSTRIDFLLPEYAIVIEVKYVRNKPHGKKIGDELIIDISHYKVHPQCSQLWIVVYDPNRYIQNPSGLHLDLERQSEKIAIKTFILGS